MCIHTGKYTADVWIVLNVFKYPARDSDVSTWKTHWNRIHVNPIANKRIEEIFLSHNT